MFDFVRNNKRLLQGVLLLLIIPSFVLVGVDSYQDRGDSATGVAEVDGRNITQQEWDDAQRRQIDQARQQMGPQFDQKIFDTPQAKREVLENLVAERAVNAEIARSHLTVSDQAVFKAINAIETFRKPDGSFDMEGYRAALAAQGLTPEAFDARMRRDMAIQQLAGSIQGTAFVPRSVASRISDINDQEREVQELVFPIAQYLPQVKVTDEMVKAFYDKNATLFQIPETVKAEYIVLDSAAVESQVSVSDAEISQFYSANQKRFTTPEQRTASHILITKAQGAKPAEEAAAKAKAEAVLAQVRANPADFAAIAKTQSQDPGSAPAGGDLGLVERGSLVKSVEDAIYGLKDGEVSGIVPSEFGYHIIKLTSLKPQVQKSLEEAKTEIAAEVKKSKLSKKYSELAEQFNDSVYEQSESLKPTAEKLGLTIQTADGLTRKPNPALGAAPFNNEKFLAALYSTDSIKNKRNTEAVEVAPAVLIAGRVAEFKPATKRPLAEVEAQIRQRVTAEEALRLARQAGEAKLAAAKASGDAAGFGDVKVLSRTKEPAINPVGALAVFKADVTKLPAYVGVDLPGQGYAVYRIGKVAQPAQPDTARRAQEAEQIGNLVGQAELYNFVEAIKVKSKAKINAAAPAKAE
ncbi:SurA N-terminal domain-containing protein [Massilia sp. Leaf139]|uniref:SurA N-terminal domain-containing protein n=1 Tax=Massilia sp. Leaf139 TaxID=1736272 RepID=UPI0006F80802|nr:SurA N-terminal domain-containing protein [Massilia sp. Leaf139]KQQ97474.1 peptidylprolyl isomerase [Massilia sp. Leaf139]